MFLLIQEDTHKTNKNFWKSIFPYLYGRGRCYTSSERVQHLPIRKKQNTLSMFDHHSESILDNVFEKKLFSQIFVQNVLFLTYQHSNKQMKICNSKGWRNFHCKRAGHSDQLHPITIAFNLPDI